MHRIWDNLIFIYQRMMIELSNWFSSLDLFKNVLYIYIFLLPLSPSGWRGIVVTVRAGGRAGGCQTCGTHISVTAWRIFSIRSSVELSRPVVVHCHGHLPMRYSTFKIWPWKSKVKAMVEVKVQSHKVGVTSYRLCGTHISETAGSIYPI